MYLSPRTTRPTRPTWTTKTIRSRQQQREELWQFIERWTGNPELVQFAAQLIDSEHVDARDEVALTRAVLQYVQRHVKFFREYPERWASPLRTLQWGIGDCDDMSILLATVLRSFRIPVRLKFIRLTLPGNRRFSHVFPQALLRIGETLKWVALEAVRPKPLGYDVTEFLEERGYEYQVELIGDKEHVRTGFR